MLLHIKSQLMPSVQQRVGVQKLACEDNHSRPLPCVSTPAHLRRASGWTGALAYRLPT